MVYLFLANGFEDMEAVVPFDLLKRAGAEVVTVGVGAKTVKSAHGLVVTADISEDEADFSKMEVAILPGGMPGAENLRNSKTVKSAVADALKNGKIIGAICASPGHVLKGTGALSGKRYTCFPGFEADEGKYCAEETCITDGRLITAAGPEYAVDFAKAIIKAMKL